jgi:hypothetical protein
MPTYITNNRPDDLLVEILGTQWRITFKTREEDPHLLEADGYCDESIKTIVVEWFKWDGMNKNSMASYAAAVIRHEMIHAMLYESGLDSSTKNQWAKNEEMVDWIAIQLPKMLTTIMPVSNLVCKNIEKDLTIVD